jgi:hypothetical protein
LKNEITNKVLDFQNTEATLKASFQSELTTIVNNFDTLTRAGNATIYQEFLEEYARLEECVGGWYQGADGVKGQKGDPGVPGLPGLKGLCSSIQTLFKAYHFFIVTEIVDIDANSF